jgi:hypothetical protein
MITETVGTLKGTNSSKTRIWRAFACVLCLAHFALSSLAEDVPLWTRGFTWHRAGGFEAGDRFSLRTVTQEGLHLTGQCAYAYYAPTKQDGPVTIEGTKTAGGVFWPDVTAQVKNKGGAEWETVSKPINVGHRSAVIIKPGEHNLDLFVALDVFRPLIEKYEVGRLVLNNGEAAVFELKDLLPPSDEMRNQLH